MSKDHVPNIPPLDHNLVHIRNHGFQAGFERSEGGNPWAHSTYKQVWANAYSDGYSCYVTREEQASMVNETKTYLMTFTDDPADSGYFIKADAKTVALIGRRLKNRGVELQDINALTYEDGALDGLIAEFMAANPKKTKGKTK